MRRGTTPTLIFSLPVDASSVECLFITFCQNKKIIIEKNINDCELSNYTLNCTLSQKDTLAFNIGTIDMQIRLRTIDGTAMASNVVVSDIKDCLKDGEI